ncbi:MAG: translation initiation factor IF-2 [Oscillospiraceae bacterium]|nr:translation initiation factor IF-2 [Oscillospiraceae bacterium]MDY6021100.1 translation initiation factor IF-2 [Oscillospiraceae bacterium]
MATMNKSKVSDIAKDFGMASKDILTVLAAYTDSPKKPSQVLEESEINFIFEYLTQKNQVKIETIFAESAPEKKEEPAPRQEAKPAAPAASAPKAEAKPAAPAARPAQQSKSTATQQPATRVPEKKIVDTRKVTNVNLDKYDEKLQDMAERSGDRRMNQSNKEKFRNAGRNRGGKQSMTFSNKRRQEEAEKMRRLQLEIAKKTPLTVKIPDEISVGELASRMKKTGAEVVKCLMKNGVMASLSQLIDFDTASFVAEELGCKVEKEVVVTIEEKLIDDHQDTEDELQPRAPVVVVMGHVDHGKTSLLDYIRNASVASGEAGGITQHIGAYQVQINGKPITFLDTPGHEAFTSMRARGAMITDIAILVVAAEDGIKPQTVESINHAKAAEIPVIVAINKMDKPDANPERVKQQLTEYGLLAEDWGGDTIVCPISAKTGMGIDNLLEMVALTAEVSELKANPNRAASGAVVEARLDKGRGPVATLLVQNGTLKQGDIIIAGTAVGRVRQMVNDKGAKLTSAGPSVPVEITGLGEVPEAGAHFNAVADERLARELVEQRKEEEKRKANAPISKVSLEDLFSQIQAGEMKTLNIIVKADVMGSVEAVKASLEKISNEEVRVRVIHGAVGAISESDVMLASTSNAIIVGFNVRPDAVARESAARSHVDMRMYRVIYDAIDEIEAAMKGMLAPKFREAVIGHAEVRQTYKVSSVGTVAGCYVTDGKIQRACDVRIVRDGIVVHEGHLASLQRFKDAVKEVASGYECGLSFEKYNDIKLGDIVEAYVMEQIEA